MSTVSVRPEGWSGISLYWEIDDETDQLIIALQGPSFHLRNFASPSDLMESFLHAVRNAGADLSETELIRARIDTNTQSFKLQWVGTVQSQPDTVPGVMKTLAIDLGIHEL